jgi:transcriptional adapter 3
MLTQQSALNDARKTRLAEVSRHRLAYVDYQTALEGIEKSIEAGWAKRIKKYTIQPKKGAAPGGFGPRPPVPENLKRLVGIRQGWIDKVGKILAERPIGEVRGLPTSSIYEGIKLVGLGEGEEETDERKVEEGLDVDADEGDHGEAAV